ncbi:F-box family [Corchorus olitorius]|uniref:F-box family n=1 Tax=Corchorus olitorius TaxID=93759 RepID=A0A1R3IQ21_9ROSI|nr:F-box family [Corchorus olitorius]
MMEEVPDEILSKIISFLSVKEAIGTSILSKRWRNQYLFMSRLNFDADTFISSGSKRTDFCYKVERVMSVYKLLQHYLESSEIESFRLWIPYHWPYFVELVKFRASNMWKGVEEVNFTHRDHHRGRIFSLEFLSALRPSKLKHLRLQSCSIAPAALPEPKPKPVLHSLAILELEDGLVDQTALETIFSTCVNLGKLVLRKCKFPPNLTIADGPPSLSCLQILSPMHLEKLQISSLPNLTYFEFQYIDEDEDKEREGLGLGVYPKPKPKPCFSNVPKLEEMRLDLVDHDMFITTDAPPQLKRLITSIFHTSMSMPSILDPKSSDPPQIPVISRAILCQLEQLELVLDIKYCNLLTMIPHVLLACPLLQKFHLTASGSPSKIPFVACPSPSKHSSFPNLKQVKIRTFYGRCGNPFVFYLLENAVALERIILDTTSCPCPPDLCKLKHMSHQVPNHQIRAKVASPTANLLLQHHSNQGIHFAKIFMR